MTTFSQIRARAEARKGGAEALAALLPNVPARSALRELKDDRVLSAMAQRVFSAGFAWSVIEAKWPGFEEAFLGFEPGRLALSPDEFWDGLTKDERIVRNGAKILSVKENAAFILELAKAHGSFGTFLHGWDPADQVGLLDLLSKRGSRLGGNTGQMLLRQLGWDGFVTSTDMVACLIAAGVATSPEAKSKKDLLAIQAQMNAWVTETGLSYTHISRICAMSTGSNPGPGEGH
jgi:3-methyladenine DNA glycosylase Tag